ncbi:hypothetical protein MLD38_017753 [Melastoma candidum]|nr:hypothetical protein MLD38_017753 [Melastoma candidum]
MRKQMIMRRRMLKRLWKPHMMSIILVLFRGQPNCAPARKKLYGMVSLQEKQKPEKRFIVELGVHGSLIAVGTAVQLEADESDNFSSLYFVEYLYETAKGKKLFHGRKLVPGSQTVLGNAANEQELFLLNDWRKYSVAGYKASGCCRYLLKAMGIPLQEK